MTKRLCKNCTGRKNKFCSAKSEFVPKKTRVPGKILAADCKDFNTK